MWEKVVVRITKSVGNFVEGDGSFRGLFLIILGAVLLPVVLALFLLTMMGSAEAGFNKAKVKSIIGEAGEGLTGYNAQADAFYGENDKNLKDLMKIWKKGKASVKFENDDENLMRIFLKATYYVASAEGKIPENKKDKEAFVKVFLGRKRATTAFTELSGMGISLDEAQKGRVYQIWCMLVHESYVAPQYEGSGIWKDFGGTVGVLKAGIFKSPFVQDWSKYVTSEFGMREHPISHTRRMHMGIDIAMPMGTEIHSCSDGRVEASGFNDSMGNYVTVKANNGYTLTYMHMKERKVEKGSIVATGDVLGLVGSAGDSTGPHLHLGIQNPAGDYINPRSVLSVVRY